MAQVSARVTPDTSGFARELKRELDAFERGARVDVEIGADLKQLQAELAASLRRISREAVDVNVGADTARASGETERFVRATDGRRIRFDVGADTSKALAEARAAAARISRQRATIKVDVDRRGVGGGLDAVTTTFKGLFSAGSRLPGLLGSIAGGLAGAAESGGKLGSALGETVGTIGGFTSMLGRAGGPIGAVIAVIVGAATALVGMGAQLASMLVVAGAVTAVVGALGAAVSGLPALLFGVAGAGAAVALGFDGIKKAAEAAKPGLDNLRRAVSDTFQRELTPVFRDLGQRVLPQLTTGFQGVAISVSGMIRELLGVFTSAEGIRQLNVVLGNTRVFLDTLTPGLKSLVSGLLEAAQTTGAFRILGEIVGGVAERIGNLFRKFSEGGESSLMTRALEQLRDVTFSVIGVISTLILKATEFFTNAGPGLKEFFDSINNTLQEIDFGSLGQSFGRFAASVGRFIDKVPPRVWQMIADSVRDLSLKFEELSNDPAMQQFFTLLLTMIPMVIDGFTLLLGAVRAVVNFFKTAFLTIASTVYSACAGILRALAAVIDFIPGVPDSVGESMRNTAAAFDGLSMAIDNELAQSTAALAAGVPGMKAAGTAVGSGAVDGTRGGLVPLPGAAGDAARRGAADITGQRGAWEAAGRGAGAGAADGVKNGAAPIPQHAGDAARQGQASVEGTRPGWSAAGSMLIAGMASAITGGLSMVVAAAVAVATAAIRAVKGALGIKSPSKVFDREIGQQAIAGLVQGLNAGAGDVRASMQLLARDVIRQGDILARDQRFLRVGESIGGQIAAGIQAPVQDSLSGLRPSYASGAAVYAPARAAATAAVGDPTATGPATARGHASPPSEIGAAVERAMTGLQWRVDLDPEGLARITARGRRRLDRR
ncbi:hypothetical protein ACQPX6_10250 [Actinomycetospora sp. CA-101289]|uniref:hypothetical protein n=1 Tax=Actinomycetospora sp. CA-101289 TaxID=3239893 RepID=UPI003D993FEF